MEPRIYQELPYFDEIGNDYLREIRQQDAYVCRGGKLTAPQMIKYENRVSMLVERLIAILEAVRDNPEDVHDYLQSLESNFRRGALPKQVYVNFVQKVEKMEADKIASQSERERDRLRVIIGGGTRSPGSLSGIPVEKLLVMYEQKEITPDALFEEFKKREKGGVRLPKMGSVLWGRYRSWLAKKTRIRRHMRDEG